jgi:rhodanese-related sulfurtransferase
MNSTEPAFEISVEEFKFLQESKIPHLLLDVREPFEIEIVYFKESLFIPLNELASKISELPEEKFIVIVCHHGQRSLRACVLLRKLGFKNTASLKGGIDEWARRIDSSMAVY